ncbi:MAG: hypothetical protein ABIQ70_04140, partial [Dokdonella sp.]
MNLTPFPGSVLGSCSTLAPFPPYYAARHPTSLLPSGAAMSRRALCISGSLCLVAAFTATTVHAANYARTYLVNDVLLPTSNSQSTSYAIDVDGDGFIENNFGQILAALTAQGIDLNGSMDSAVASGSIVHLVRLQSTDAFLNNDPAAQATWCVGVPT